MISTIAVLLSQTTTKEIHLLLQVMLDEAVVAPGVSSRGRPCDADYVAYHHAVATGLMTKVVLPLLQVKDYYDHTHSLTHSLTQLLNYSYSLTRTSFFIDLLMMSYHTRSSTLLPRQRVILPHLV